MVQNALNRYMKSARSSGHDNSEIRSALRKSSRRLITTSARARSAVCAASAGSLIFASRSKRQNRITALSTPAAFTAVFNITGQPAISLPLHVAASGLPVGIQIVAGPWREAQLLRVASQLEQADPWADRQPRFD